MTICSCGNEAAEKGGLCARCAALKELELEPGATNEEIKKAFHELANAWRPNLFPQQLRAKVEEKRETIDAAYSLLLGCMEQPQSTPGSGAELPLKQHGEDQESAEAADSSTEPARDGQSGTKWRGMLPQRVWTVPMPIALGCGVIVSGIVVGCVLLQPLDAALESNPVTARIDDECKAAVRTAFAEFKTRVWEQAVSFLHYRNPPEPIHPPAPSQQTDQAEPKARRPAQRNPDEARPDVRYVLPLITAGLSKSEVIAVQGNPTETTDGMLVYGRSELYFRDDKLIGWKIDPASPIRVKLWPDASVDPDLDSFGVGSTKNEVIVVQGTPTFLSENTFGYRRSEVYFKNNRVVGWKADPSSPLRVEDR